MGLLLMKENLVSVIIPTYNRKHTICHSLESVLNQTYSNIEVIIVDDGSTDNTSTLIKAYSDNRIQYIYKATNQGVAAARNTGIALASGEYIAFQDSDDIWHPDKLEKQLHLMNKFPNASFCYHKIQYQLDQTHSLILPDETVPYENKIGNIYGQMLHDNLIPAPALLARSSMIQKNGFFDTSFPALEDYDFALRLSKAGEAVFVDEILLDAQYSTNGVSGNPVNYLLASCLLLQKFKSDYIANNQLNHRIEIILRDSERLGMKEQFIHLLEKIMVS